MKIIDANGTLCEQSSVILPVSHKRLIKANGYTITGICRSAVSAVVKEIETKQVNANE